MSTQRAAFISAIIAFISAVFGWFVAQTDNDTNTKPDTEKVIDAGEDLYETYKDLTPAEVTTKDTK